MKRKLLFIPVLLLVSVTFYTCCKAGMGGDATLVINVLSDSKNPLYGTTVYIKYGQSTAPASINKFDDHIVAGNNTNTVTFAKLKCGTYYLFATGFDSVLNTQLSGGSPLSITHGHRKKTTNTNMYISP